MKPSGILEASLYTDDLAAAEEFYGGVLGLDIVIRNPDTFVFFRCGEAMLLVFNPEATRNQPRPGELPVPGHGAVGQGHVCFRADRKEIDAWKEKLIKADVAIESEVDWPGGGHSVYFRDPAGNSLEFAEPRIWGLE